MLLIAAQTVQSQVGSRLKANIDSAITNKTAAKSVTALGLGTQMKASVDTLLANDNTLLAKADSGSTGPTKYITPTMLNASFGSRTSMTVTGSTSDAFFHANASTGYGSYIRFSVNGTSRGVLGMPAATTNLQIRTGTATDMNSGTLSTTFYDNGNVGIKTTTAPTTDFCVNGTGDFKNHVIISNSKQLRFTTSNAYAEANGSAELTIYGFNLVSIRDGSGEFIKSAAGPSFNSVAINRFVHVNSSNSVDACAAHQVTSTTRGVIIPRHTSSQRAAVASPGNGVTVYDTDLKVDMYHDGTGWYPKSPIITNTAGRTALTPREGWQVYDTDTKKSYTWDGTTWQAHY